jgi:hypothetical protein
LRRPTDVVRSQLSRRDSIFSGLIYLGTSDKRQAATVGTAVERSHFVSPYRKRNRRNERMADTIRCAVFGVCSRACPRMKRSMSCGQSSQSRIALTPSYTGSDQTNILILYLLMLNIRLFSALEPSFQPQNDLSKLIFESG